MAAAMKKRMDLLISPDRLTAAVRISQTADLSQLLKEEVYDLLSGSRIPLLGETQQRVARFLAECGEGKRPAEPVPLAVGRPAVNGSNASLQ